MYKIAYQRLSYIIYEIQQAYGIPSCHYRYRPLNRDVKLKFRLHKTVNMFNVVAKLY